MKQQQPQIDQILAMQALDSANDGITIADATNPELPLIYANHAFERLTQYSKKEILGKNCRFLQNNDRDQEPLKLLREKLIAEENVRVVIRNYRRDGSFFWNELSIAPIFDNKGALTHYIGIQKNITAEIEYQKSILHLANEDQLTHILNRRGFIDAATRLLEFAKRQQQIFGIGIIDINTFKEINDTCGHDVGDIILKQYAAELQKVFRKADVIGRLGGDEFIVAVISTDRTDNEWFYTSAEFAANAVNNTGLLELQLSISAGFSLIKPDSNTMLVDLIQQADRLMYQNKRLYYQQIKAGD